MYFVYIDTLFKAVGRLAQKDEIIGCADFLFLNMKCLGASALPCISKLPIFWWVCYAILRGTRV